MSIKVLYFASLREDIGRASDELSISDATSVLDVWRQATEKNDLPEQLLIAVNQQYCSAEKLLEDGDEVAFFPPVTGG